jgi:IS30 family transposase
VNDTTGLRWFHKGGGMAPLSLAEPARSRTLTIIEREQILVGISANKSIRAIAGELGRSPSTISRELDRNLRRLYGQDYAGRNRWTARRRSPWKYSPHRAQLRADKAAARPKPAKLATNERLRDAVQSRLKENHSPEQIGHRLVQDFPNDLEMRVSHEAIYQSLFVESRGGLKRSLTKHLRTGRSLRKPRRRNGVRQPRIKDMVMISERPAEVEDRAVPGHWEGDLVRHEALHYRAGVRDLRRRVVAAA